MLEWHKKAEELELQGYTIGQIAAELGRTYTAVQTWHKRYLQRNKNTQKPETPKKSDATYSNGNIIYNDVIEIPKGETLTPEYVLKLKKLPIEQWEVVSFVVNVWQGQRDADSTVDMYQTKLTVRPRKEISITFADIDKYFEDKSPQDVPFEPINYNQEGETLEIDIADLHCGLLAWRNETNDDFDLHICSDRFLAGIDDIVKRCKGKNYKQIYFCTLGDILHIDNDKNETTKGTYQQADGRLPKIFDFAFDTMHKALEMLRQLNCPINYVYLCGNHDRNTGYFLVKLLEAKNTDIVFDTRPNPQKAIHFDNVLIGLTHGDMPKSNKGTWLINDYRREFGASDFVEEHSGHIHEEEARKHNGIMVRSILAQCGNSYWEHQQGYRSKRGIMCFVWCDKGLRETFYYYY